jgi:signal transduction histidine kinase/DNA-binding response OmpR family regulator
VAAVERTATRPRILCIDDTPDVRTLVLRLLGPDYAVLEADDGLQGIELAENEHPDLVLVDLHMPGLTGYEVATRIKALLPGCPVVALTADVGENVRERALASGCDGYLSKPIDPDGFVEQIAAYLSGEREFLDDDSFRQAYQHTLVVRLEEKVRELTRALHRNAELNEENVQLLEKAQRQARLLEAGARVSQHIISILDLDALLEATVDAICDEFGFYYAGVFLVERAADSSSTTPTWAVLCAGRGDAGAVMVAEGHKLQIGGHSMVGVAMSQHQAIVAGNVEEATVHYRNRYLPDTRSEMALPLIVGNEVIGALTVQSVEEHAFSADDTAALQSVADHLAMAIGNTRSLEHLQQAHQELMRSKTYEAIANATGEAIHWVGNKAAPIPGSVERVRNDIARFLCIANMILEQASPDVREQDLAQLVSHSIDDLVDQGIRVDEVRAELEAQSLKRLRRMLSAESILEDLSIIEQSARAILGIKEDLIGPARQHKQEVVHLDQLLEETIGSMGLPKEHVQTLFAGDLLPVEGDPLQLQRVFINLIKNAMEAMEEVKDRKLFVWARRADDRELVVVDVIDNGVGIPPESLDKIWMAFYTTKGNRGGTGLGLPACAQIIGQLNGKIVVESEVGSGTTFSVFLPIAEGEANV